MTDTNKPKSPNQILNKIENKLKITNKGSSSPIVNRPNNNTGNNNGSNSADFERPRGTLNTTENPTKNTPMAVSGHFKANSTPPTLSNSNYAVDNTSPKDSMMDSISFSQTGSPRALAASPKNDNWVSVSPKTDDKTKSALTELKSRLDNMTLELARTEFYAELAENSVGQSVEQQRQLLQNVKESIALNKKLNEEVANRQETINTKIHKHAELTEMATSIDKLFTQLKACKEMLKSKIGEVQGGYTSKSTELRNSSRKLMLSGRKSSKEGEPDSPRRDVTSINRIVALQSISHHIEESLYLHKVVKLQNDKLNYFLEKLNANQQQQEAKLQELKEQEARFQTNEELEKMLKAKLTNFVEPFQQLMKVLDNDELPQSDGQPIDETLTKICTKIKTENDRTRKEINEILKNEPNIKIHVRATDVVDLATLEEREQDDDTIKFIKGPKGEAIVRAANVDRLVERLTSSTYSDVLFRDSFLLTYRSFMTSTELMEKLIDRYCVTPVQKDLSAAILEALRQKQVPIRSRVLSVIKRWIDKFFFDFSNQLFERMFLNFLNNTVSKTGYEQQVQPLIALYNRKKQGVDDDKQPNNPQPPEPLLPMFIKFNGICDLNPVEVARQITLIEASLFKAIKPYELLNQAWTKKDKETKAPNALRMIRHSSRISYLVVHEILRCDSIARRVEAIKRFVDTAHVSPGYCHVPHLTPLKECSKIGNFNAVMELTAGLGNVAVSRLQKTWREVENEKVFLLEDLQEYSNNNYKILRSLVHSTPSVIPFLGVYLTDLTFIEDGSKDLFGNLINFSKHLKIAEQILELQRFQQSLNYNFKPIDYMQNFIENSELIDEETAYEMSVKLEAKKLPKVFDA